MTPPSESKHMLWFGLIKTKKQIQHSLPNKKHFGVTAFAKLKTELYKKNPSPTTGKYKTQFKASIF